ncbi:MAG TPA: acyltransferase family protein, partial [Polymorphobacter sp.]|nr:acyltransferase family protein [Polymorphobacter sp.]
SLLAAEAATGSISMAGFYERRARRIVPALVFVLLLTSLGAVAVMPPSELEAYGASLRAAALFYSNVFFHGEIGYFAPATKFLPLLHIWSLAVEEQFYIVWPLLVLMLAALRRTRLLPLAVALVVLVSLAAAVWMQTRSPAAGFYLTPFRMWELGLGALLAVVPLPAAGRSATPLLLAGLALIVGSMLWLDETMALYMPTPLPACLGAVMVLYATADAKPRATALLTNAPMRAIGHGSYSLYLWHWPALVLPRIALDRELTAPEALAAVAVAAALTYVSLRFVEAPWRDRRRTPLSRTAVLTLAAAALLLVALAGTALQLGRGLPGRASPGVVAVQPLVHADSSRAFRCATPDTSAQPGAWRDCTTNPARPTAEILLLGDSHAYHLAPGLAAAADARGLNLWQLTKLGCSLVYRGRPGSVDRCALYNRAALAEVARHPELRAIIVSSHWADNLEKRAALHAGGGKPDAAQIAVARASLNAAVVQLIADLHRAAPGARIVLVGTTPEFTTRIGRCVERARFAGRDDGACLARPVKDEPWAGFADATLAEVAAATGNTVYLPRPLFCDGDSCRAGTSDTVAFRDHDHLSAAGSHHVATGLFAVVDPLLAAPRPDA